MHLVRYVEPDTRTATVGVFEDGLVRPLDGVTGSADLLGRRIPEIQQLVTGSGSGPARPVEELLLLPPIDGLTEVWASGVTYERSMDARVEESASQDVYTRIYHAHRPELFFKAPAWRVVTDTEPIAVREDSAVTVPEPELALVLNAHGELVGYTVCNDVSSRDIEGENPLYIPQAKTYSGSCALATGIRPAWEIPDATALGIRIAVVREGKPVFSGETSTERLHRSLEELASFLFRALEFPAGAVLATGTGIVPELDFTLQAGDRVDITIDQVGSLSNPVTTVAQSMGWPVAALEDPASRQRVRSPRA
jgi:2-dehydro-3-deoxy-D-arabinonate dehydratase